MIEIYLNDNMIARDTDWERLIARLTGLGYINRATAWNMVNQASRGNIVIDKWGENVVRVQRSK